MSDEDVTPASRKKKTNGSYSARLKHNIAQQQLRAWQPVLTPKCVIITFFFFAVLFVSLGVFMLLTTLNVVECEQEYDDPAEIEGCDWTNSYEDRCTKRIVIHFNKNNCKGLKNDTIKGPVYLYYKLTNFHQNHRSYIRSVNWSQLSGKVYTDANDLTSCYPTITTSDKSKKVLHPCGAIATSVFNDTFKIFTHDNVEVVLDESENIVWEYDLSQGKFKNPTDTVDPNLVYEWLPKSIFPKGIEDPHFIVWMRLAALPNFRKLYGIINADELNLPLSVEIMSRFKGSVKGKKYVVLSQTCWLGGRNIYPGAFYVGIGCLSLLGSLFLFLEHLRSPRYIGDVQHLTQIINRSEE